jgi:hypothetical protein
LFTDVLKALKAEIAQLKALPALASGSNNSPSDLSNTVPTDSIAIAQKLASYQTFMEQYMVNAQNQKLLAIREAELKAEKKFQERLEKLLAASSAVLNESIVDDTVLSKESTLFEKRNARVIAASKAGVSRWGIMEVERAEAQAKSAPVDKSAHVASRSSTAEMTLFDKRNAKIVAAANAGKSRWGNMEIDRAKGIVGSVSVATTAKAETSLFDQRNAKIVASAAAGESRWGNNEVVRAGGTISNVASAIPASSQPAGVNLEDRVNIGAQLLSLSAKAPANAQVAPAADQSTSLFVLRNAKVVAAATAGKSRWGSMEIDRAKNSGVSSVSKPSVAAASLFDQRNAKIVAAANAGKSRWGNMEIDRAKNSGVPSFATSSVAVASLFDQRNAKVVAAANAGRSRWGSMEIDRAMNSGVSSVSKSSVAAASLFDQRNAKIVAAANAGKSRWGSMEIDRAKNTGGSSIATSSVAVASLFDQRNAKIVAAANAGKSRWGNLEVNRAKTSTGAQLVGA